jgi:hypothetical protein
VYIGTENKPMILRTMTTEQSVSQVDRDNTQQSAS